MTKFETLGAVREREIERERDLYFKEIKMDKIEIKKEEYTEITVGLFLLLVFKIPKSSNGGERLYK